MLKHSARGLTLTWVYILAIAVGASLPRQAYAQPQPSARERTDGIFRGRVYDIDFIKVSQRSQVLAKNSGSNLVAFTSNPMMQSLLQTALMLGTDMELHFENQANGEAFKLTFAKLTVQTSTDAGRVQWLQFDEKTNQCKAEIHAAAGSVVVVTSDPKAQGILETAARESIPVGYLMYDGNRTITRVKINVK